MERDRERESTQDSERERRGDRNINVRRRARRGGNKSDRRREGGGNIFPLSKCMCEYVWVKYSTGKEMCERVCARVWRGYVAVLTHLAGHLHQENQVFGRARVPAGIALLVRKLQLRNRNPNTLKHGSEEQVEQLYKTYSLLYTE